MFEKYKMDEIINNFLLAGDKFISEMHLRQPGFTCSASKPQTKKAERIPKFKETEDSRYIYQNELDKACFQEAMVYGDFKDLPKRIDSDNVLGDKAFNITKYPRYDGFQGGLVSIVSKFFDKKTASFADKSTFGGNIKTEIVQNKELAEELHKPIIKKF